MKKRRALVTGGAGFIGSHLAEALCDDGVEVVILDNLSSGSLDNLQWRKPGHKLEFVQADVSDSAVVEKLTAGCHWVFHHAAMVSVPRSVAEPEKSHEDNLNATFRLLTASRKAGVERFIFASSSAIYGDSEEPVKHESLPPNPLSPYALQKFAGEKYAQLFHDLYAAETVCLRYFNVFGPRQSFDSPYSGVIARFCTAFLENDQPVIFGDGLQSRDFTYVENVIRANLQAVKAPASTVAGRIFNIAGGKSINLLELIERLNDITGKQIEPKFESARPGDIKHSRADISLAEKALGFDCKISWQEGLNRTLSYYHSKLSS
ncbi:MAG: NAD-dependent epimerase/dehydratase family protein [Verrucomicrobia bacterium]|nr:NAD-dependent epimerase/dehydratase family protein [Verrucomicrobiota bacterium]MCF7708256.1 NAD-dependent epimerase/dehydratase family protein [Verrucomicrobiota bacterium]